MRQFATFQRLNSRVTDQKRFWPIDSNFCKMHIFLPRLRLVISRVLHPSSNPDKTAPLAPTVRKQWTRLDCLSRNTLTISMGSSTIHTYCNGSWTLCHTGAHLWWANYHSIKGICYTSFQNTYKVSPNVMVCDPLCLRVLLLCFCWLCWFPPQPTLQG